MFRWFRQGHILINSGGTLSKETDFVFFLFTVYLVSFDEAPHPFYPTHLIHLPFPYLMPFHVAAKKLFNVYRLPSFVFSFFSALESTIIITVS